MGEDFACRFLRAKGYNILTRNFHSRFGEIDIVAQDKGQLVFVEVKTRNSSKFGSPLEAVTENKLAKIRMTGEYFMLVHTGLPREYRIEVLGIWIKDNGVPSASLVEAEF